jgi:hypothetical protein
VKGGKVKVFNKKYEFAGLSYFLGTEYCIYSIQYQPMTTLTLQQERARILEKMAQIDHLIRGQLSQQTYQVQRRGQLITQGPYYLLQRRENGKNNCQRVSAQELEVIVAGVEGHRKFQQLAEQYALLTERMTWEQQGLGVKKKFRRFWKPISPKPPHS